MPRSCGVKCISSLCAGLFWMWQNHWEVKSLIKGIIETVISRKESNTFIKDCLDCYSSTLQESQISAVGNYPVYGATGISGYAETADANGESILVIKDGSGVGSVKYANGEYSYIGTLNCLTAKNSYCLKYLYFALRGYLVYLIKVAK